MLVYQRVNGSELRSLSNRRGTKNSQGAERLVDVGDGLRVTANF